MTAGDPLAALFADVAEGRYPEPDSAVSVVPADATTGLEAVLGFTAHAVIATGLPVDTVLALGFDGLAGAYAPDAVRGLAGSQGWIGVLDVALVARATGEGPGTLTASEAHEHEHRVQHARETRADVRVLADDRGLVTLGRGLGGRLELGFDVRVERRGEGLGRALLTDALGSLPAGTPVFAASAPGNARSLRCLLAAGFVPFGAEQLLRPSR